MGVRRYGAARLAGCGLLHMVHGSDRVADEPGDRGRWGEWAPEWVRPGDLRLSTRSARDALLNSGQPRGILRRWSFVLCH